MRSNAAFAPLLVALFSVGSDACVSYRAGALLTDASGRLHGASFSCLDIAADATTDSFVPPPNSVLAFSIGNRCDAPVHVDLTRLQAVARWDDGTVAPLTPYDPRREIRPAWLDGRAQAVEEIEFDNSWWRTTTLPAVVCVDVSRVNLEAPTDQPVFICVHPATGVTTVTTGRPS